MDALLQKEGQSAAYAAVKKNLKDDFLSCIFCRIYQYIKYDGSFILLTEGDCVKNKESSPPAEHSSYRSAIEAFLQERLQEKLKKLKDDEAEKGQSIMAAFTYDAWLADAAKRVEQIQAVTHSLKPIHSDARGTNIYAHPATLPTLTVLGSHALGQNFAGDVVGNAAALDVYKFLKLEVKGRSLLTALLEQDEQALQALHSEPEQAQALSTAFTALTQPRTEQPSSHTLAKQVYWLQGGNACADTDYVLLAPLYPTSLAHAVYAQVQEDRFSPANKAARLAKKEGKPHDGIFRDYPGLAVQKMGGTKPQNISQLNSERGGVNYLLASLPPQWRTKGERLPVNTYSVFERFFTNRPPVRRTVQALQRFLQSNPEPNQATRQRRESLVDGLLSELMLMASELHQLPPGWSADSQRFGNLHRSEQLWLDPLRAEKPSEAEFAQEWLRLEWPAAIAQRFANWLNAQLRGKLPVGDAEAQEWAKVLLSDEDGFQEQLRALRRQLRGLTSNAAEEVRP